MTSTQNAGSSLGSTQLDVSLLIESEVVHRGVRSLLDHIARVQTVSAWPVSSQTAHVDGEGHACHVVIVGFEEWHHLAGLGPIPAGERPWVLLLGDETHIEKISLRDDLPCDGVMMLTGLNTAVLDAILGRVVAGELPMPAVLARDLLAVRRCSPYRSAGHAVALTARERETLGLLAQGFSNKQIAAALRISSHGVKRLVAALFLKLGAPNRTTAVIIAMNEGLV
jgi:two-component system, NarL family, nitrate/nitrite response regulator NarL